MKKFTKIGLAAVLMLGVSAPVMALDAKVGANVGANANTSADTSVDATATGSVQNYGNLVSSLQTGTMADLNAYTETSLVKFVLVSSLKGNAEANAKALDNAISKKASDLASLHTAIKGKAALKAKIEAGGYSLDDVLWIETNASGEFIVYVDDRV